MGDRADDGVAPVHEGDFFVLGEGLGVFLVDEDGGAVGDFFGAEGGVFAMFGFVFGIWCWSCAFDSCGDGFGFGDCNVTWGDWVDMFFVGSPEEGPVEVDDVATGTLFEDVFAKSSYCHSATTDTSNCGEAGIVPTKDGSGVDELSEFSFRKEGADKVHARKVPDMYFAEMQGILHPIILGVTVSILVRSQGMCDTF